VTDTVRPVPPAIVALETELRERFRTTTSPVQIAGDQSVTILHPASADELITEDDFVRDERLPYWADIWPSAVVLARFLRGLRGAGRTLLELGCGSGVVATAAACAGFDVTATDYYEDAPRFARVNAWHGAGVEIAGRHADWTAWPSELTGFDLVVASDVLYEQRYADLVARTLAVSMGPHGEGWIADPGRVGAEGFAQRCADLGLGCEIVVQVPIQAGAHIHTISLHRVTR
jgi:predicted nicotinamide N-methyase